MSSMLLNNLKISIFGQSHGPAVGVVVDGLPAGEPIDLVLLQTFLDRRAPGKQVWTTARHESDRVEILSGLVNGRTCGAPLAAVIRNENANSKDYAAIKDIPRPGHADFTLYKKYGSFADCAGGGHLSGRLTAPLCIAGGIALQLLKGRGVHIGAHISQIGSICDDAWDPAELSSELLEQCTRSEFPTLGKDAGEQMRRRIAQVKAEGDSIGGTVTCAAVGVPAGLGDPIFDGMENRIARIVFGIPAVKGISFGAGFQAAERKGSENNDAFVIRDGTVRTTTNEAGGILGGITTGMPLVFCTAFKPTPSISKPQMSINLQTLQPETLEIRGRHDPCIVPRAVPCVEAAAAAAILDAWLEFGWTKEG